MKEQAGSFNPPTDPDNDALARKSPLSLDLRGQGAFFFSGTCTVAEWRLCGRRNCADSALLKHDNVLNPTQPIVVPAPAAIIDICDPD